MKNLKLSTLLSLSYAFIGLGLLVVSYFAFTRMAVINDQSTVISDKWLPSVATVGLIDTQTAEIRALEALHIISVTANDQATVETRLKALNNNVSGSIEHYQALMTTDAEQRLMKQFIKSYQNYLSIQQDVLALSRQNQNDQARALFTGRSRNAYDLYTANLRELSELIASNARQASEYGDSIYAQSITVVSTIVVIVIALLVLIAIYITRSLTQQIQVLQKAMTRLADGDLTVQLTDLSNNEIGTLSRHFNTTVNAFSKTITEIQDSSNQLASTSEELSTVTEQSTRGIHRQTEELEQAVSA
ncbi:MCP four helix bundle domain-containing protein, partial [Idiomarina xiamenensis]